jgi:type IV pilus assembly protein PilW
MVDFNPGAFFIGVSQSGNTRSLYQFRLQVTGGTTAAMVAQELIEGVQDLRILYGEDTSNPPNRRTDQYVTADAVSNWNNVVSVRIHLLLASVQDNIVQTPMTVVFPPDTGNNFTAGDRRLYQAFSTTVGIRNRLP